MTRYYSKCERAIKPGDSVAMGVLGVYGDTASAVVFGLQKGTVEYIQGTLMHETCAKED